MTSSYDRSTRVNNQAEEVSLVLSLLKEDHKGITYRPKLCMLTGSVLSAILLQQIVYRWSNNKREPFYKFSAPCSHKLYQLGDSWQEELAFSRYEFESALNNISTKITKGTKKASILAVSQPKFDDRGKCTNAKSLVIHWTDSDRVSWYQLNETLFTNAIKQHYLGNVVKHHYLNNVANQQHLEMVGNGIISFPKNITKNTTKNTHVNMSSNSSTAGAPFKDIPDQYRASILKIFRDWQQRCNHMKAVLDQRRVQAIFRALLLRLELDRARCNQATLEMVARAEGDLLLAVLGCSRDSFAQGDNDRNRKFDDIELICRDAAHLERFMEIGERFSSKKVAKEQPPAGEYEDIREALRTKNRQTQEQQHV
jgi:hypothetical protein